MRRTRDDGVRITFDPPPSPTTVASMSLNARRTAIALATLTLSVGAMTQGAQADTIPTVHFSDLVAGQSALQYGEAFGVWSCWKDPKLKISLFAMDANGAWQVVSTDNTLTKDPVNCDAAGLPYRAVNAWTVSMRGSQPAGVKQGVIILGLGQWAVTPKSKFGLVLTGQVSAPQQLTWDSLIAGESTLPLRKAVTVDFPDCSSSNLYALGNTGTLGTWQQVASGCSDSWRVKNPGSQGVGTQAGLTLLAAGPTKPAYLYGLAKVNQ